MPSVNYSYVLSLSLYFFFTVHIYVYVSPGQDGSILKANSINLLTKLTTHCYSSSVDRSASLPTAWFICISIRITTQRLHRHALAGTVTDCENCQGSQRRKRHHSWTGILILSQTVCQAQCLWLWLSRVGSVGCEPERDTGFSQAKWTTFLYSDKKQMRMTIARRTRHKSEQLCECVNQWISIERWHESSNSS